MALRELKAPVNYEKQQSQCAATWARDEPALTNDRRIRELSDRLQNITRADYHHGAGQCHN